MSPQYLNGKVNSRFYCEKIAPDCIVSSMFILNTSNGGKQKEFSSLFQKYGESLTFQTNDLREIKADPLTVIAHKASQVGENILVEDTSFHIAGEEIGVSIRYFLSELDKFIGKNALWQVLLAYREGEKVYIFEGRLEGTIVTKKGDLGFGFDPFFLPKGAHRTLAEEKPDCFNARSLAVDAFFRQETVAIMQPIFKWEGPWQSDTCS